MTTNEQYLIGKYISDNSKGQVPFKRKQPDRKGFSSGYFGAQGFNKQAELQMAYAKNSWRYIDLTAGGNGVPYRVASELGIPVTTNDMGFYSYCMANSVLRQSIFWDYDAILKKLLDIKLIKGWYSKNNKHYSEQVAQWIDGACSKANEERDYITLAAIGRTLVKNGFRGMGFSKTAADGTVLSEMPLEHFILEVFRNLYYLHKKNISAPFEHYCFNMDAGNFVQYYPTVGNSFHNATVYMDPAWPWLNQKSKDKNPYAFVSQTVSSILKQETIQTCRFWNNDEEEIKTDIKNWVETPLAFGAKTVIVNTQSTNYPDPKIVASWFPNAKLIEYNQHTALAKDKNFVEYLIIIEK